MQKKLIFVYYVAMQFELVCKEYLTDLFYKQLQNVGIADQLLGNMYPKKLVFGSWYNTTSFCSLAMTFSVLVQYSCCEK